jgi:ubiquinone/menaquinone biosynthesis C-methylase UbiE
MTESPRAYVPAAGRHWALPFYDPFNRLIGIDRLRQALLDQGDLRPGHRVLDIGCGTGTFAVMLKEQHPDLDVVGLDPDPQGLARARRKAERAGISIRFDEGFSDALPYADASFDRVFSSFMFHHLGRDVKQQTLREARRVLKPGGRFELLDFRGPEEGARFIARLFHSHERLQDNAERRVLSLATDAGLADARCVGDRRFLLGRVGYYQASRAV